METEELLTVTLSVKKIANTPEEADGLQNPCFKCCADENRALCSVLQCMDEANDKRLFRFELVGEPVVVSALAPSASTVGSAGTETTGEPTPCPRCSGDGAEPGFVCVSCSRCGGEGVIHKDPVLAAKARYSAELLNYIKTTIGATHYNAIMGSWRGIASEAQSPVAIFHKFKDALVHNIPKASIIVMDGNGRLKANIVTEDVEQRSFTSSWIVKATVLARALIKVHREFADDSGWVDLITPTDEVRVDQWRECSYRRQWP